MKTNYRIICIQALSHGNHNDISIKRELTIDNEFLPMNEKWADIERVVFTKRYYECLTSASLSRLNCLLNDSNVGRTTVSVGARGIQVNKDIR